ncbi:co-chaperone GroES [Yimella radicis]
MAEEHNLPIRMLHDRLLVKADGEGGERRSGGGIVIPATAAMGKRLAWAEVVAVGQHVRQVQLGDRVLYDPDEKAEVELQSRSYILLRERDLHAVAAQRVDDGSTGLYL